MQFTTNGNEMLFIDQLRLIRVPLKTCLFKSPSGYIERKPQNIVRSVKKLADQRNDKLTGPAGLSLTRLRAIAKNIAFYK